VPTYDYQCRNCGHTIEVIHSMMEEGPTTCERCGGELRRILHPAGIIFKGSGFYKTDSRSASSASVASKKATPSGPKSDAPAGGSGTTSSPASGESGGSAPAGGSQPATD
jgi:putative FmdB family regulatory protein